jgi:predicted ester cyclase
MNAIVPDPISITLLSSTSGSKLSLNADKSVGWKSEAQRLAWGANRRAQSAAISVERNAQGSAKAGSHFSASPAPILQSVARWFASLMVGTEVQRSSVGALSSAQKEQENKAIADRWLTNFWGKDYDPAIVEDLAARHIFFNHSLHTPRVGLESLKTFMADLREAFPDFRVERTANLVAEGDVVMSRWVCEGTHTGPAFYDLVMGALPEASGRTMRFTGMSSMRLENGKIVEEIELADGVTASSQLGFIRLPVWPA